MNTYQKFEISILKNEMQNRANFLGIPTGIFLDIPRNSRRGHCRGMAIINIQCSQCSVIIQHNHRSQEVCEHLLQIIKEDAGRLNPPVSSDSSIVIVEAAGNSAFTQTFGDTTEVCGVSLVCYKDTDIDALVPASVSHHCLVLFLSSHAVYVAQGPSAGFSHSVQVWRQSAPFLWHDRCTSVSSAGGRYQWDGLPAHHHSGECHSTQTQILI